MRDKQVAVNGQGWLVQLEWMSDLVRCSVWVPVNPDTRPNPTYVCSHRGREYVRVDMEDRFMEVWEIDDLAERSDYAERIQLINTRLAPAAFAECFPWLACQAVLKSATSGWADFEVAAAYEHLYHEDEV